jgi:DNA-binding YbaB/EbfC family protein
MFGNMGQMLKLIKEMPRIKEEMQKFQERLPEITAEGAAGGGMVTAKVNGKMQVQALTLTEEAMALQDREMLEDLIIAAVNQAGDKVREAINEESAKMTASFGIPEGLNLPGL